MTATEKEDSIAAMEIFRTLGTRLIEENGFSPDRETVLRVGAFLDAIEEYRAIQQDQNARCQVGPKKSRRQEKEIGNECQADRKECPLRGPGEMTCQECRSLQKLYEQAHAIEDILIEHGLVERREEHQYLQAACSVVDYQDTHIRIVFQDPMFQRLNTMEWFSPLGNTWITVVSMFFAPFLTEEDWEGDDDE